MRSITYELEEALELLAALEEVRDTLRDTEHLASVLTLEAQIQLLSRRRLVYERKIRYVMIDGIAHIPEDALAEYRRQATS